MTGIKQMFQEYSGEEVDWFQLAFYFEQEHAAKLERNRQWRKSNRIWRRLYQRAKRATNENVREYHRNYTRQWRATHAEHARAVQREQKRAWRAKNREEVLLKRREADRRYREKQKARAA